MLMFINSHSGVATAARKTPVQQRSRRTVDAILGAAARILVEDGYSAMTTNDVAAAAGVSIGSLYQYFPNKDALLRALVERHLDAVECALATRAAQWRDELPDPDEWASSFVELLVQANNSELDRLLYAAAPVAETSSHVVTLVKQLSHEVAFQLDRFGHGKDSRARAQVLVVATLSLVHEVVLPLPGGARRRGAIAEVVRLVRLGARVRG
jgi:AcrR family transcriptional regulator